MAPDRRWQPRLDVLDLMMTRDFYAVNRSLRSGRGLDLACSHTMDDAGWRSRDHFAQGVAELFAALSANGALGTLQGQRAYRSLLLRQENIDRIVREGLMRDDGYAFATLNAEESLCHLQDDLRHEKGAHDEDLVPLLLAFTVGKHSLNIPSDTQEDPLGIRRGGSRLEDLSDGQVILDRHSFITVSRAGPLAPPKTTTAGLPPGTWLIVGKQVF